MVEEHDRTVAAYRYDEIDRRRFGHEGLARLGVHHPLTVRAGERDRDRLRTTEHLGEQIRVHRVEQRRAEDGGREERTRCRDVSQLLHEHAEIDRRTGAELAELLEVV